MFLRSKLAYLPLFIAVVVTEAAIGPVTTLDIANKDISPDEFTRAATVVNGAHPGPLITAKKGNTFKLNVVNQLADVKQERGISVHWHGLFQRGANFMDSAAGVTQCPIAPGKSIEYSLSADRAGTLWYHSHFGELKPYLSPIVIYDPSDPLKPFYDVDDETTVITLSEWYHTLAASIHGIPSANITLINRGGRFPGGPKSGLAVVNVHTGKRYRLRVVSISCDPFFTFSIDGHDLQVIEVEGTAVWPVQVNSIELLAGQRYSVVLNANQPVGNYWIRSLPNSGYGGLATSFDGGINSAILRRTRLRAYIHATDTKFVPGKHTPDGADLTVNLTFGFDRKAVKLNVNGAVFEPPTVPVLLQILSGVRDPHDLLPSGGVITVPRDKVIQINVPSGLIGGPHPFHMHGHGFVVVKSADTGRFNFLIPVVRDVVNMGETEGDYIAIRFKTDNPGLWIFHCHINFHQAMGLAIVFAEALDETAASNPVPDSWKDLCPTWDALPENVKHPQVSG